MQNLDRYRFRIWCHHKKRMLISGFSLDQDGDVLKIVDGYDSTQEAIFYDDVASIRVMQCTGLRDSNNNLIYEGDVVYLDRHVDRVDRGEPINSYHDGVSQTRVVNLPHIVKWQDRLTGFYLEGTRTSKGRHVTASLLHSDQLEVVGNIYETPDFIHFQEEDNG